MTKNDLKVVKICGPTEAEMIREMLANNGIDCNLQGEQSAQTLPAAGELTEVRIWVSSKDFKTADELITAFFETEPGDSSRAAS